MPYYKKSEAEIEARGNSANYPGYRFTVKTIKSRHGDRFAVNSCQHRLPIPSDSTHLQPPARIRQQLRVV